MKKHYWKISVLLIMALFIVACNSSTNQENQSSASEPNVEVEQNITNMETIDTGDVDEAPASTFPAWYSISLTDVNTGAVFTVEENLGKVILVETLATWCSKCLQQQVEVNKLHELLGDREDFESLGIDIDPNEDIPLLTGYVRKHGFDWLYVVASDEMIDEISVLYGPQFLNPPSTPMLIIDKQGISHPLGFGIKSAEELFNAVIPYLES